MRRRRRPRIVVVNSASTTRQRGHPCRTFIPRRRDSRTRTSLDCSYLTTTTTTSLPFRAASFVAATPAPSPPTPPIRPTWTSPLVPWTRNVRDDDSPDTAGGARQRRVIVVVVDVRFRRADNDVGRRRLHAFGLGGWMRDRRPGHVVVVRGLGTRPSGLVVVVRLRWRILDRPGIRRDRPESSRGHGPQG